MQNKKPKYTNSAYSNMLDKLTRLNQKLKMNYLRI